MNHANHFDIFSGIGGFALAAQWTGFRTVGLCEIDPWCRGLLAERFPGVPVHADVRGLRGEAMGRVDLLTGGFPCQPWSSAGRQLGTRDDRHLWPEMLRLVRECRPAWVIGENVAGIIQLALDACLADLEAAGYAARAFVVPAVAVNAPHRRDRVWIVAHRDGEREQQPEGTDPEFRRWVGDRSAPCWEPCDCCGEFFCNLHGQHTGECACPPIDEWEGVDPYAHSVGERLERLKQGGPEAGPTDRPGHGSDSCRWEPEPELGRVAHGIPRRVDRITGLGNAIVPQVAAEFMHAIRQLIA